MAVIEYPRRNRNIYPMTIPWNNKRDIALELLRNRPARISLKDIANDTGLTEGWLSMFSRDKIIDPSYTRLETLYEYLIKLKAKV